jgi:hypothetical protein
VGQQLCLLLLEFLQLSLDALANLEFCLELGLLFGKFVFRRLNFREPCFFLQQDELLQVLCLLLEVTQLSHLELALADPVLAVLLAAPVRVLEIKAKYQYSFLDPQRAVELDAGLEALALALEGHDRRAGA